MDKFFIGGIILIILFAFASLFFQTEENNYNVSVQSVNQKVVDAAEGLDLRAVGALLKEARTAKEFEKLLNDKSKGINNLDLNEDGKVDFIKVTEYGNEKSKGFSLTVDVAPGEEQEVATVTIEKSSDGKARVETHGNSSIYGRGHYYRNSFGLTDFLILSYLFNPHPPYYSSWYYGSYPSYYRAYSTVPYSTYNQRVQSIPATRTATASKSSQLTSSLKSPNANKTAKSIRAPLRNPTSSQKSFQARNPSKQIRSGGFGKGSKPSRPSVSSGGRRSSFGRGK